MTNWQIRDAQARDAHFRCYKKEKTLLTIVILVFVTIAGSLLANLEHRMFRPSSAGVMKPVRYQREGVSLGRSRAMSVSSEGQLGMFSGEQPSNPGERIDRIGSDDGTPGT